MQPKKITLQDLKYITRETALTRILFCPQVQGGDKHLSALPPERWRMTKNAWGMSDIPFVFKEKTVAVSGVKVAMSPSDWRREAIALLESGHISNEKMDELRVRAYAPMTRLYALFETDRTVHLILSHTARSGTYREINPIFINAERYPLSIAYEAGEILGYKPVRGGLAVKGGGMDMGFHLVYSLSTAMFYSGYFLTHPWL